MSSWWFAPGFRVHPYRADQTSGLAVCRFSALAFASSPGFCSSRGWRCSRWRGSPDVAQAQEGGGSTRPDEPLILFMIKSLGWIFGPLLLAVSVALVALVRAAGPRPADERGHPAGVRGRVHRHRQQAEVQGSVRHGPERPVVPRPGADRRHEPPAVRPRGRPRGGDEHARGIKSDKEQKNNYMR